MQGRLFHPGIFAYLFLLMQLALAGSVGSVKRMNFGRGKAVAAHGTSAFRRGSLRPMPQRSTNTSLSNQYSIGYYQGFAADRTCDNFPVSHINTTKFTHVNYAFVDLDTSGSAVVSKEQVKSTVMSDLVGLKSTNPDLKVYAAVGGWSVPGQTFSELVAAPEARKAFIDSALQMVDKYGFDGLDIDWEYPSSADRGGVPADSSNYVTFLQDLRNAMPEQKGLTITIPGGTYNLQGFDMKRLNEIVSWFNVMSYDLHGVWDNPKVVYSHTNMSDIETFFATIMQQVPANKLVLGLAYYGKTYTLADQGCTTPGCPFTGAGDPGPCTASAGVLSNKEIADIIARNAGSSTGQPVYDGTSRSMYFSWGNQWVCYDNQQSLTAKKHYAADVGLLGTQVWAIDEAVGDET